MTTKRRDPEPLGHVLTELLAEAGGRRAAIALEAKRVWAELVGPALAAHTRVADVAAGACAVEADHPVYAQEIKLRERELGRALAVALGEDSLRLAVVTRGARGARDPAVASAAARSAPEPGAVRAAPDDAAALDRIADPELRAALASLRGHLRGAR